MDLDDFDDGPKQGPTRASRFAPKGSKFQPKPKLKTEPTSSSASLSLPAPKKEEVDVKPEIKPEHDNGAVAMDVDINLKDKKLEMQGDFMDTAAAGVEVEHEDGDEDEVVREIDVYFAPSVHPETRLYLFQYPLRPRWRPYELDGRCKEVRVKPTSAEVEVDLDIDVDSMNYDAADGRLPMEIQTLAPSWKPPETNGYTVGVLNGNKLHLNPIHAAVQLRPSMRHLSEKEPKKKTTVSKNAVDVVKLEEQQDAKPSGTSKIQKAPEQANDNVESWIPLKYHDTRSGITSGYLHRMIAREGSQIVFSTSSDDYLNSLCPGTSGDSLCSKVPPSRSLLAKPLKERFKTWLREVEGPPLHRFDTLKHLAPDDPIEEVLAVLQELAVLVQGLWVPRTSWVCYGAEAINVFARNFVLLLFTKDVIIKEDQIPKSSKLAKAMKDVLHGLATKRPTFNDWKLKEVPDFNFIKLNPAIVKTQQEQWATLEKEIDNHFSGGRNGPVAKTLKSRSPANPLVLRGSNKLAAGTSSGSTPRNLMSEEDREAVRKVLQKVFKTTKPFSYQQISQRVRDMAVSESQRSKGSAKEAVAVASIIDAYPDEVHAIISEIAVNIHGICVPKSSPDHPEYDDLRKIVIDLFLAEGPNAKLRKAHITLAANMKLKDMSDVAYKKVLQELCVSQGSAWVLRSADSNS